MYAEVLVGGCDFPLRFGLEVPPRRGIVVRGGRRLRNERDALRVFYLHAVDILSALFITDDLVCGVGGEKTRSPR